MIPHPVRPAVAAKFLSSAFFLSAAAVAAGESPTEAGVPARSEKLATTVVTASRTARDIGKATVKTELITSDDIRTRAAVSLSDAAELVNGVRVEPTCQNCNTSEIQMLGLGGAYNQILFDGMPVMSSVASVYGIEQISAAFIDRMEIVKGGVSSLYGAGAVAGVVNLISEKPERDGGYVRTGIDVQKDVPRYYGDARLEKALLEGKLAFNVIGQGSHSDSIDFNGDGFSEVSERIMGGAGTQLWYAPNDGAELRFNYQYIHEDRRGGNALNRPEHEANIAEAMMADYHRAGLSWRQQIDARASFSLGYSFAFIDRDTYYGGLGDPSGPGYDPVAAATAAYDQYGNTQNPVHLLDHQWNIGLGDHDLTLGVQYKRESVTDENLNARGDYLRTISDLSYDNVGVFAQDEWHVTRALDLVPGARVDKHSMLDEPVFSPRLAAAWRATPTVTLRPAVSTGFRAPDVFSEDLHVETLGNAPLYTRNGPGLKHERSLSAQFGVEWKSSEAAPLLVWDATASRTVIDDTFVTSLETDSAGNDYWRRSNGSGSSVTGVESNLAVNPDRRLTLNLGAAYYLSRYDEETEVFNDGAGNVIGTRDFLKTPRLTGAASAIFRPADGWSVFSALRYTGVMDVVNNRMGELRRTRDFWTVDAGVTRTIAISRAESVEISLGVKNIFDQRQRDLESGPGRDSTYVYGPRQARTFYATARLNF